MKTPALAVLALLSLAVGCDDGATAAIKVVTEALIPPVALVVAGVAAALGRSLLRFLNARFGTEEIAVRLNAEKLLVQILDEGIAFAEQKGLVWARNVGELPEGALKLGWALDFVKVQMKEHRLPERTRDYLVDRIEARLGNPSAPGESIRGNDAALKLADKPRSTPFCTDCGNADCADCPEAGQGVHLEQADITKPERPSKMPSAIALGLIAFGLMAAPLTGCAGQTAVTRTTAVMEAWAEAHEGTVQILEEEIAADLREHCHDAAPAELDSCLTTRAQEWREVEDAVRIAATAQDLAEEAVYQWALNQGPEADPSVRPPEAVCRLVLRSIAAGTEAIRIAALRGLSLPIPAAGALRWEC